MRIAIAPDSFKGTLTAREAAEEIERGLKRALPGVETILIPMADGGEGTVQALADATGGGLIEADARDPLGRPGKAAMSLSGDGSLAVIEMAAANGLPLLKPTERNPLLTTTLGTGDLIRHALEAGVKKILIGIGGSATNDGGMGMAKALGCRFLDAAGEEIDEGGGALSALDRIDASGLDPRLKETVIEVACDVDNPMTGPKGASQVFGPQKGASPAMVHALDANLGRLAKIVERDLGQSILSVPGAGAAGGLGGGLMAFCGGTLRSGVEIVVDAVGLKEKLADCDLMITGEGRMDGQTVHGKTPAGAAAAAKAQGLPVIAIAGSLGQGAEKVKEAGIDAVFAALSESLLDEELPGRAPAMLAECAEQVGRLIALDLSTS